MRLSRHVALTLAFATPAAFAQASDAPALAPITVSADPLGLDLNSTALPTTILDGQELVERRQGTLGDTLDGLPGVHADTFGGGASRPVIRGQTAPRVSVLSDGSQLMDASAISPDHATTVEPLLADRIEVLRGPATLRYGGGAIGGVVNVLDKRVPTEKPEGGLAAEAELRGATGTKERAGVFGITGGTDDFVVRVEGLKRRSSDYEVPDWPGGKLAGSYSESTQGSIGMSWIGPRGYVGVAFTHIDSKYGLPGHNHEYESCHPHGDHLHCGGHGHDDGEAHDHDHGEDGDIPYVRLRSNRVDLRAEYLDPLPGFAKLRFRSGFTDYQHDEIEGGKVGTRFKNEGFDARLELEHKPWMGLRGVMGVQTAFSDFRADGEEAFLPRSKTRANGIFLLEEYRLADWRFEAGARQDWQSVSPVGGQEKSSLSGTSLSAAAIWDFAPRYSLALSVSRSQRLPSAQELYADGVHLATNTYEIGNAKLDRETSRNIDLTLRKHEGDTTFSLSAFHNRVKNYIYANTLDRFEDFRLIEYTQQDAEFTGVEGEIKHQFTSIFSAGVFGDYVRGKLTGGQGDLPRIPAARLGARANLKWQQWSGGVEYAYVFRQKDIASYESETPGYSMVNAVVSYRFKAAGAQYDVYLRGNNLLDKLAYNHASFLATSAPLPGRSVLLGVRMTY
ncbi:TonB-dependent receptor domain-containing protein [Bordetella hinzii]|uniref:TonB-dependent receptor n=2 Tax=Bordetella hinzii TaxID=103855 RepID=A0AAN1VF64_9BORD|nr:TonB-dependent receptor [Bordetella hinzii]AKQ53533.1 putative TonB-dependent receptor precursor [Bordetella hinzii]AKQ58094.1 putative TonB-dependent receptor precursor [Bordetella hinzii]AZW16556.1 TonB-dependent receptor [Bordetella hinzii]KCB23300.1 TonB-dependent receptor [Bordetella hinzii OH87 BAL007II]KCB30094.1 TonB-dependent receptor [Bordetella hinzii L60]